MDGSIHACINQEYDYRQNWMMQSHISNNSLIINNYYVNVTLSENLGKDKKLVQNFTFRDLVVVVS